MKKILLGLTTTPRSDWIAKAREIDELGLTEIALFPTFLKKEKRKDLYELLEKTNINSIPHIHLREEDMDESEIDYLIDRFGVKKVNVHRGKISDLKKFSKYKSILYIENQAIIDDLYLKDVEEYSSGICLDLNHFERYDRLMHKRTYKLFEQLLEEEKIGCCHIGAFNTDKKDSGHFFHRLSEFDYVKKYSNILPHYLSLELENSFADQLKVKKYLEDRLSLQS